jgi:methenyltetrahydromethanopterin cyclohydrolase
MHASFGCTIIDAGIDVPGGLEAGRIITEICLGGMGTVSLSHTPYTDNWPITVNVHTSNSFSITSVVVSQVSL